MKRGMIAAGIIVLLLGLGGAWLWSLGSVPAMGNEQITITVDAAPVDVKQAGKDVWEEVTSGMTLRTSDQVRTEAGGRATINWYGRAETRLQEQSTIVIDAASLSGVAGDMGVMVRIQSGRVWSRVLRLFDLDESFAASTNNVVATVRGTAFDLALNPTDTSVWVSDSAIDITDAPNRNSPTASHTPFAIADGHRVHQSAGAWSPIEALTTTDLSSDWFMRNHAADQDFLRSSETEIANQLSRIGRMPSSGFMRVAMGLGENLHVMFAGADAPRLRAAYLMRQINDVKGQIDEGRSGLAYQSVNTVERDLDTLLTRPDGAASIPYLRRMFAMLATLLHDDNADSPRYRLKQRMEEFVGSLSANDRAGQIFASLLAADARLDEVVALADEGRLSDAKMGIDAAVQGLGNAERDLSDAVSAIPAPRGDALRSKIRAVHARIDALSERIRIMGQPTLPEATSTDAVLDMATSTSPTTTSTTPVRPVTTPATSTTAVAPWDTLTLSAQPNPVAVGGKAALRLMGSRLDGSSGDLTSQATFRLFGSLGQLNGSTFIASAAGSVTVEATIIDHGVTKSARTTIQVNDAVKLVSIKIMPNGPTTVRPGAQVLLTVTATYSSGLTADVTSKTSWTTSDATIGTASGRIFSAAANGQGSVTITGSYTESGTTVQSAIVFTVDSQAALF